MGTSVPYSKSKRGVGMGAAFHAHVVGHFAQSNVPSSGIARECIGHVSDEMRQLVAGVDALKLGCAVEVVFAVDLPMHVKHHDGVDAQCAATAADLFVPVNRGLALCQFGGPASSLRYMRARG